MKRETMKEIRNGGKKRDKERAERDVTVHNAAIRVAQQKDTTGLHNKRRKIALTQ